MHSVQQRKKEHRGSCRWGKIMKILSVLLLVSGLIFFVLVDDVFLRPLYKKDTTTTYGRQLRVLVAPCVANSARAAVLWEQNLKALQRAQMLTGDVFDIWMLHFDGQDNLWENTSYSNATVTFRTVQVGCKVDMWLHITPEHTAAYDYIWLLDGDLGLEFWDWQTYRKSLTDKDLISQPAVKSKRYFSRTTDHWDLMRKWWTPWVVVNTVTRIELMTPFIHAGLWPMIHQKLKLTDSNYAWEIELFWCDLAANISGVKSFRVMQRSPVVHYNWRAISENSPEDDRAEWSKNRLDHLAVRDKTHAEEPQKKQCRRGLKRSKDPENLRSFIEEFKRK
jgi:hypothetical protein